MAAIAILATVLMVAPAATAPLLAWTSPGPVGDRAVPMDVPAPWVDAFDDSSRVNTTRDTEVVSGEVRVTAGMLRGVVASVEIACPPGHRYDILLVEAWTPGASTVKVSVLNATRESQQVGYVNEPIPGFERRSERDVPLTTISPTDFPRLRLQADLETSGTDRPALLTWAVHYVPLDEWRDDFYGLGKMTGSARMNVSGGRAELNLAMKNSFKLGYAAYDAYPPILANSVDQSNQVAIYPNPGHTNYAGPTSIPADVTFGSAAGDLDVDGFTDLFVANYRAGTDYTRSSMILWGDSGGTWSTAGATLLQTDSARKPSLGDVNGDGLLDVLVCSGAGGAAWAAVFLNPGTRAWAVTSAVNLPAANFNNGGAIGVADLDGDGYEDVVLAENYGWSGGVYSRAYMGGPGGPDATPDIYFKTGVTYDVDVNDYNKDGFPDLAFADTLQVSGADRAHVFISDKGTFDGNSSTYQLDLPTSGEIMNVDSGDVNGDGWLDLVFGRRGGGGTQRMYVFWGSASGFSNGGRDDPQIPASMNDCIVIDVDKDGYADVISAARYGNRLDIFKGATGTNMDGTADIQLNTNAPLALAVGVGRERMPYLYGSFTTTEIARPLEEKWDILVLEGDFPANTEARVTVLDNAKSPIAGYADLKGPDIDLSAISIPVIYVRIELRSLDQATTPYLDRLLVNWMPKGSWREQFYGKAKSERFVNVGVGSYELRPDALDTDRPQLLVTSLRADAGYGTHPELYLPRNGFDYASTPTMDFAAVGTSAASVADVNGDGFQDVAFAVYRTSDTGYDSQSPLFLNSAVGWRASPDHAFPTSGASDVLLRDINGDGHADVVFAQEQNGLTYAVNSTLFWGRADGTWNATPDVQFTTKGASGVVAADMDGDGDLDLAFACFRDMVSTATDSMVFMQDAASFCGTVPSHLLPTRGARAVDAGDVDRDGRIDLAFANSFSGGFSEIDSYIYWGKAGGGFETAPALLRTSGAEDVKLVDIGVDNYLDVVFANHKNNLGSYSVDSVVYSNDRSGGFSTTPDLLFPTTGATAVEMGTHTGGNGRFLVFSCMYDGATFDVGSVGFVRSGSWPSTPTFTLPTPGATDVLAVGLISGSKGGYMSKAIVPEDPANTGAFHTLRYTARLGAGQTAQLKLVDSSTWQVLAETAVQAGTHEVVVKDAFRVKEHPNVRVVVTASGLDLPGDLAIDDLWLNWTTRVKEPPQVLDVVVSPVALLRLAAGELWVNATDEYDPAQDLRVVIEHRLSGASTWSTSLLSPPAFTGGTWRTTVRPRADSQVGTYDVRVEVTDSDGSTSGAIEFKDALRVLNNLPTAPVVRITPDAPTTVSALQVDIVQSATDLESAALGYRYQWSIDGVPNATLTSDTVTAPFTERGQNWSVEVRAFDGIDESAPATAWVVIVNAPPQMKVPLPNPEIAEDSVDSQWLDLSKAFEDPDGDVLTYSVDPAPQNIRVSIDPATGVVTLRPAQDWFGQESLTFVATDGEYTVSRSCLVTVTPVNDRPFFKTVNDQPITSDPVEFNIVQGEPLVINVIAGDVEGDELVFSANSTIIEVDGATGRITFQPDNNEVGTLRFALTLYDTVTPSARVTLNFTITVGNTNDPMDAPRIVNPRPGDKFKAGTTFSLIGVCTDPDTQYGQQLTFTWRWNGTNPIGSGTSLTTNFTAPGTYNITLTVSDGEFSKSVSVDIVIEPKDIPTPPPPPPPPVSTEEGMGTGMVIGIIIALVVIGGIVGLMISRRREQRIEDAEIAKEEDADRQETLKRLAMTARTTADAMELEIGKATVEGKEGGVRTGELEEVTIASRTPSGERSMVSSTGMEEGMLTMKPKETEAASKETMALFKDMARTEAPVSAADQERMRIDNLKRKYQNAIGRLPYGIPAQELRGMDWVELASALASGEKRTLGDGRETTQVKGRWYYSDPGDTSSFLTEHGARPKAEPRAAAAAAGAAAPPMDKAALLAKLEERLILGEISEETYRELKRKYEAGGGRKGGDFEWVEEANPPK